MSGYQDSNLGPPAPKAGALTGLRYTPSVYRFPKDDANVNYFFVFTNKKTSLAHDNDSAGGKIRNIEYAVTHCDPRRTG